MIEFIKGTIEEKLHGQLIIDTGHLGYNLRVSAYTLANCGKEGSHVKLFTFLNLSSPPNGINIDLYGFLNKEERELFIQLGSVSGIGNKTALQILSDIKYDRVRQAIYQEDLTLLSQAHGVSKNKAKKIILELKEKLAGSHTTINLGTGGNQDGVTHDAKAEARIALTQLGYNTLEALQAINAFIKESKKKDLNVQEIIAGVLKNRGKSL